MMKHNYESKILLSAAEVSRITEGIKQLGKTVVFTNGCFDLIHRGHMVYLQEAANLGDFLVIGLNTDASIKSIKGKNRPVQSEKSRAAVLASLGFVDLVVLFNEDTPADLIQAIIPDILVKGGDYEEDQVVGADTVKTNGGEVKILSLVEGESTTNIIERIKNS